MLAHYRAAYAPAGSASFSLAAFVSRFSIAIYPIALVLVVSARTGDYGFGGVVSGVFVAGEALGNPLAGGLVDKFSQHRMLPIFVTAHVCSVAAMGVLLEVKTPLWTLLIPAVLMGVTQLNIGALVRARWSYVWAPGAPERVTAYSVESTLDEVIFVLGPLIATVLATHGSALLPLGVGAVMVAAGSSWLAAQRSTEPPVRADRNGHVRTSALSRPGMAHIAVVMAFTGAVFGSAEVTIVAFCGQHHHRADTGWAVAAFAFGSGVAGLFYGARRWTGSLLRRFVISSLIFGVLPLLFFAAVGVRSLIVIAVLVGLGIAPTLIGAFGLVDQIVPAGSLTEGLTWVGSGLSVGFGVGSAAVGGIADSQGARVAFAVPAAAAVCAAGCALLLARKLSSAGAPDPTAVSALSG